MHITLTILGLLSGICLYVGTSHALDARLEQHDRRLVLFAFYSIFIGLFGIVLACRYQIETASAMVIALKWEFSILSLTFMIFPWFVQATSGVGSQRLILIANILAGILFIANLNSPYSLQYTSQPAPIPITLQWGELIWLPQGKMSTWFQLASLYALLLQLYAFYAYSHLYNKTRTTFSLWMLSAIVLSFATTIQGILVRMSVFETLHLGSFGLLGMVIVMSTALSRERTRQKALLQQDLQRTQELQKAILDYAGYAIISGTPDGTITSFNPAAEKMLGYSAEELIGKHGPVIFHDRSEIEERARQFSNELDEPIEPGFDVFVSKLRHGLPNEHEWTYIRKDGSRIPVLLTVTALRDNNGQITGFLGVAIDISERNRAIKALRESEEKYRLLFENMTTAFALHEIICDDAGKPVNYRYLEINPAFEKLTGVPPSALMGKTILEVLPNTEQYWIDVFGKVALTGQPTAYENFSRELGKYYETWVFSPRKNQFAVIFSDSTERRNAEEELKRHREHLEELVEERTQAVAMANQELEAFSYSVSHDLRAPLRSIDGFSQILAEDYTGKLDSIALGYLQRIRKNSQHMAVLIDDLLQLARIGRAALTPKEVDLSAMAIEIAKQVRNSYPEQQVKFEVESNINARADPQLLSVVMTNLLDNAWKYTSKTTEGLVEFGKQTQKGETIYYIHDNGAGFDMRYVDKLFGAFQRLHSVEDFPGTGIGLATVQRIIKRHGGRVWAKGEINNGATFFFTLTPAIEDDNSLSEQSKLTS